MSSRQRFSTLFPQPPTQSLHRAVMSLLPLSIATADYDHCRDFRLGAVRDSDKWAHSRPTWDQMSFYTFQQGIAHRPFTPEEIFPAGIMTPVVI